MTSYRAACVSHLRAGTGGAASGYAILSEYG